MTAGGRFGLEATAFMRELDVVRNAGLDLLVDLFADEMRAAATRIRAIHTLADFDARTAEIAASLNPERSAT